MTRGWAGSRPQNGRSEDLDSVPGTIGFKLENKPRPIQSPEEGWRRVEGRGDGNLKRSWLAAGSWKKLPGKTGTWVLLVEQAPVWLE